MDNVKTKDNEKFARDVDYINKAADTLQTIREIDADAALTKVKKQIHKQEQTGIFTWIQRVAAILMLPLLITSLYYITRDTPVEYAEIRTNPGMVACVTLPDNSKVWINSQTVLRYPSSFNDKTRKVELDGEAFFDISKNVKKPFIVQTGKHRIEVLGTRFNVESYSRNNLFETALMEGSVKISSDTDNRREVILSPNQMLIDQNGKWEVSGITDYDPYLWKDGLLSFKNKPFHYIMVEFEQMYGVKIIVENEAVTKHVYTGKVRHSDGIYHALRALQLNVPFQFTKDDESNTIYIN